jgi:hypothetical protein
VVQQLIYEHLALDSPWALKFLHNST